MKSFFLFIAWVLVWLALESTVLSNFPTANVRIDMVFLAVVATGFYFEFKDGLFYVLIAGIATDAVSYAPFGICTASYVLAFSAIRLAASTIYVQSVSARFVWTSIISSLTLWGKATLLSLALNNLNSLHFTLWNFLQQSLFNGLLAIFVIPLFHWYITLSWEKIFKSKGLVLK